MMVNEHRALTDGRHSTRDTSRVWVLESCNHIKILSSLTLHLPLAVWSLSRIAFGNKETSHTKVCSMCHLCYSENSAKGTLLETFCICFPFISMWCCLYFLSYHGLVSFLLSYLEGGGMGQLYIKNFYLKQNEIGW